MPTPTAAWPDEFRAVRAHVMPDGLRVLAAELDPSGLTAAARRLVEAMRRREPDAALVLPARHAVFAPTSWEADIVAAELECDGGYLAGMPPLPPGAVVLDIGAHIGMFSLTVLSRRPDARVISVEPFGSSHRALRRNLELHGGDCVAVRAAVAQEAGTTTIRGCRGGAMVASIGAGSGADAVLERTRDTLKGSLPRMVGQGGWGCEVAQWAADEAIAALFTPVESLVPVVTVSDLLRRHGVGRVDLLKIDVEGSECRVLDGIVAEDWSRLDGIVAEVSTSTVDGFLARLRAHGFVPQVRSSTARSGPFGDGMFLVRARRDWLAGQGADPSPAGTAAQPLTGLYEWLQAAGRREWPGEHVMVDLSVDGDPLSLPWRAHGAGLALTRGGSWARYLLDRYVGDGRDPSRLTAVFGERWPADVAGRPALVAARLAAASLIDRLVRGAGPAPVATGNCGVSAVAA